MKKLLLALLVLTSISAFSNSAVEYSQAKGPELVYEVILSGDVAKDLYDNLNSELGYRGNKVGDGIICGKDEQGYACTLEIGKAGVYK